MWVLTTLLAVFLQLGRNTASKKLSKEFSPLLVSLARFLPGIPLALAGLLIALVLGAEINSLSSLFFLYCALMGICQAVANVLLVKLFAVKSFALSISLVKLETVFLALLAIPMLGESIRLLEWAGIAVAMSGLLIASIGGKPAKGKAAASGEAAGEGRRKARSRAWLATGMALGSGFLLALSGIFIKQAYAQACTSSSLVTVLVALPLILAIQSLILLVVMAVKGDFEEFRKAVRKPALPSLIGALSAMGSFFWFLSFSLASLQAVRTLGQSEFILACLVSLVFFKERPKPPDYIAISCIVLGSLLVAWA
jgi:drug/metabolite transporter (DMT)-like permease